MSPSRNQEREAREARDRLKRYTARNEVHARRTKRRLRDNAFAAGGALVLIAAAAVAQVFYFTSGPGAPVPEPSQSAAASTNVGDVPTPDLAEYRTWTGELTLNDTVLSIELDGALAPQAVSSFVKDIQDGYFTGKTCHRLVLSDSAGLLQCGSLDGTGASDPSYSFGPIENAPADNLYTTGTIAMARQGDNASSNGHQFFIVFSDTTLPADSAGGYTVIGKVTLGLDLLQTTVIDGGLTPVNAETDGTPNVATTITNATIQ